MFDCPPKFGGIRLPRSWSFWSSAFWPSTWFPSIHHFSTIRLPKTSEPFPPTWAGLAFWGEDKEEEDAPTPLAWVASFRPLITLDERDCLLVFKACASKTDLKLLAGRPREPEVARSFLRSGVSSENTGNWAGLVGLTSGDMTLLLGLTLALRSVLMFLGLMEVET